MCLLCLVCREQVIHVPQLFCEITLETINIKADIRKMSLLDYNPYAIHATWLTTPEEE